MLRVLSTWGTARGLNTSVACIGSSTIRSTIPTSRITSTDNPFDRQFISPHYILANPSNPHRRILTSGFESQERAWVYIYIYIYMGIGMGVRTRIRHKPPPSSAGAMFSSPLHIPNRERCRPCSTPTRGKLCQIQPEPYTKLVECHHVYRLHFAAFAARNSHSFQPFRILDPMACYPSITAHFFDILRPIVAHYATIGTTGASIHK